MAKLPYPMDNYKQTPQDPKAFLRTITIIFFGLIAGQVLFAMVAFSIAIHPVMNLKPTDDAFFYIVPLFVIAGGFAGNFLFKKQLENLETATETGAKLKIYQASLIIRYALSEGPGMFAIVSFILTNNIYFLLIAGLNILYFLTLRPTAQKMEDALHLSYQNF